jgi:hypothetical protein
VSLSVAAICTNGLFYCQIVQGAKVISATVDVSSVYASDNAVNSVHVNVPLSDEQM